MTLASVCNVFNLKHFQVSRVLFPQHYSTEIIFPDATLGEFDINHKGHW